MDAYTRRILVRHEILSEDSTYEEVRQLFENALAPLATDENLQPSTDQLSRGFPAAPHPPSKISAGRRTALTQIYNEMHGLIVGVGKDHCKKAQPLCDGCPLQKFLPRL